MRPRYGNLVTGFVEFDDGSYGCYPYAPLGRGYTVDRAALRKFNQARSLVPILWPIALALVLVFPYVGLGALFVVLGWHQLLVSKYLGGMESAPTMPMRTWAKLQANRRGTGVLALTIALPVWVLVIVLFPLERTLWPNIVVSAFLLLPLVFLITVLRLVWQRTTPK